MQDKIINKKNRKKKKDYESLFPEEIDYISIADKLLPELLRQLMRTRSKYRR
jgi:hypothetical protein